MLSMANLKKLFVFPYLTQTVTRGSVDAVYFVSFMEENISLA